MSRGDALILSVVLWLLVEVRRIGYPDEGGSVLNGALIATSLLLLALVLLGPRPKR